MMPSYNLSWPTLVAEPTFTTGWLGATVSIPASPATLSPRPSVRASELSVYNF
jgi:hypothetical protein